MAAPTLGACLCKLRAIGQGSAPVLLPGEAIPLSGSWRDSGPPLAPRLFPANHLQEQHPFLLGDR